MKREKGLSPRDPIFLLGEAVAPPRFSARKSKERIEEALAMVNKARQQYEEVSPANDFHMLGLCHDLRNMTDCAEMYFTAALERKETRGWHYREDFLERDDANWRKWIDLKLENGKIVIRHTKIPFENYKTPIQPMSSELARILENVKMSPVLEEV
jgi:succinate dehydrogenase/fumarate reductase flavoprotein subunit